jgi:hypothetical protein
MSPTSRNRHDVVELEISQPNMASADTAYSLIALEDIKRLDLLDSGTSNTRPSPRLSFSALVPITSLLKGNAPAYRLLSLPSLAVRLVAFMVRGFPIGMHDRDLVQIGVAPSTGSRFLTFLASRNDAIWASVLAAVEVAKRQVALTTCAGFHNSYSSILAEHYKALGLGTVIGTLD